jgi:predicted RNA-binding Zn-ribbon protein involved in translation (DUF1610 family)
MAVITIGPDGQGVFPCFACGKEFTALLDTVAHLTVHKVTGLPPDVELDGVEPWHLDVDAAQVIATSPGEWTDAFLCPDCLVKIEVAKLAREGGGGSD